MAIYSAQKGSEGFRASFRICDSRGVSIGSCDQFLTELNQRDCSAYTQRAYAIGLAHFFDGVYTVLLLHRDSAFATERASGRANAILVLKNSHLEANYFDGKPELVCGEGN